MFYLVKKPLGIGSNLVAKILKRVLRVPKIGFAGTLDPLATGLMIIGTHGTPRLFPLLDDRTKTYKTTIRLDGTTASYDLEQPIESLQIDDVIIQAITPEKLEEIIQNNFLGEIMQVPPSYSATWIDGKRSYELARKGEMSVIQAKKRYIHKFHILKYEWPLIECEIVVSHGTYIRSIARDLGELLGTGGYLEKLERTAIGELSTTGHTEWIQHNDIAYMPVAHTEVFPDVRFLTLDTEALKHLRLGSTPLPSSESDGNYFIQYSEEEFGYMEVKDGQIFPVKNCV